MAPDSDDTRLTELQQWLAICLPGREFTLASASADASFRRYFRLTFTDGQTLIAMDAPPAHEDCSAFVKIAGLISAAGLNAPRVLHGDLTQGFLLLSDLGRQTFLNVLNGDNADALYGVAVDALLRWQSASRPGVLPAYDEALLRRELDLFPQWYLATHRGIADDAGLHGQLEPIFKRLIDSALAQPCVWVHRDYMPRNLMVSDPDPGILDFQDAVHGPITYDLASLLRDAFISWPEERQLDWTIRYWQRARALSLPVDEDFGEFYRSLEWMGLQRHLKVLGIFARLNYRDGKPNYLRDESRFLGYVRSVAARYAGFGDLMRLCDRIEARAPGVAYTF